MHYNKNAHTKSAQHMWNYMTPSCDCEEITQPLKTDILFLRVLDLSVVSATF